MEYLPDQAFAHAAISCLFVTLSSPYGFRQPRF
jgi:hypothetical protein